MLLLLFLRLSAIAALPRQVCVTGAGGQTGMIVMSKLLGRMKQFEPVIGIVRTAKARKSLALTLGLHEEDLRVADVTDSAAVREALAGCTALIICTSAKPQPLQTSMLSSGKKTFGYPDGDPEDVDWFGQKTQINAAYSMASSTGGPMHVVLLGSMGGTNPEHPLNSLGQAADLSLETDLTSVPCVPCSRLSPAVSQLISARNSCRRLLTTAPRKGAAFCSGREKPSGT